MVSERIRTGRLRIVRTACLDLVRELGMYHYDPAKKLEEPIDEDNHAVDALRYLVVGLDRNRTPAGMIETDEQQQAREQQEAKAERARKEELDRAAHADPFDERWFQ
jgi:hypothetical protein